MQETVKECIAQTIDDHLKGLHFDIEKCKEHHKELNLFKESHTEMTEKVSKLEKENYEIRRRLNKLEMYSRKKNIKLLGVKQEAHENCKMLVHNLFLSVGATLKQTDIMEAPHLKTKSKPVPIIVQVANADIKGAMWKYSKQLQLKSARLQDDLPTDVFQAQKVLKPIMFEAKRQFGHNPHENNNVTIREDALILNGCMYTVDRLHLLPQNLQPANIFTRVHGDKVAFFSKHSPLSNHYHAPFKVEGIDFSCSEQFYMLAKARAFGDEGQSKLIMETKDPVQQKRLGSNIKGYKAGLWKPKMEDAMEKAVREKFV